VEEKKSLACAGHNSKGMGSIAVPVATEPPSQRRPSRQPAPRHRQRLDAMPQGEPPEATCTYQGPGAHTLCTDY